MHKKEIRFQLLCHIIMGIAAVVTILPLILLFISSITANKDITLYGYSFVPVSYTHLDVYKRQVYERVVPLCEALCFPGRLYRFYADKVWMGYR